MTKEILFPTIELETLASGLANTFVQRWDLYPQQMNNGSYVCIKRPLTLDRLVAHLLGDITLGAYVLSPESLAHFVVIDADNGEQFEQLVCAAASLRDHRMPAYLERSRRGGHLWLFFEGAVPGMEARAFGRGLLAAHGLPSEIELYPKQDVLQNGPGSLIRMPFGIHRKDGTRYGFIHPDGRNLAASLYDQITTLCAPQTVSQADFDKFREIGRQPAAARQFAPIEAAGGTLSASIKAAISVRDFVGRYVELNETGKGHCPFHDDRNQSFSVNAEQNYWHCFAGCGGGSLIDFWMRIQNCDFKTAVKELAGKLLK